LGVLTSHITARSAGFRYVTLTCRHHDGFSLYDTRGLSTFDAPHACGRDLVAEFVDACREQGLVPFFYHTLEDWHEQSCPDDWPAYPDYLQESLRLALHQLRSRRRLLVRRHLGAPRQGLARGRALRHGPAAPARRDSRQQHGAQRSRPARQHRAGQRDLRARHPQAINLADSPKYVASEMSETFGDHWGYAAEDIDYKSPADVIREIVTCRRHGSNMLLNVGPRGDGSLRALDAAYLGAVGQWTAVHDVLLHEPRPTAIEVAGDKDDFLLRDWRHVLPRMHPPSDVRATRTSRPRTIPSSGGTSAWASRSSRSHGWTAATRPSSSSRATRSRCGARRFPTGGTSSSAWRSSRPGNLEKGTGYFSRFCGTGISGLCSEAGSCCGDLVACESSLSLRGSCPSYH